MYVLKLTVLDHLLDKELLHRRSLDREQAELEKALAFPYSVH